MAPPPRFWSRRRVLTALGVGVPAAVVARPMLHLGLAYARDKPGDEPALGGLGDASGLDGEQVERVTLRGREDEIVSQLRGALDDAKRRGLKVSVAGARHSMGGHTRLRGQLQLDTLAMREMRLEEGSEVLWVQAGARWREVLAYLDARGWSPRVMQSNADFTVGGSVSVNCHGWQPNHPPIAGSVESLRLMLADGAIATCSRAENAELFSLVLGGYGLFGVVLDVRLRLAPNRLLRRRTRAVDVGQYVAAFDEGAQHANMAYGRLSVAPSNRLSQALLTTYEVVPGMKPLAGAPAPSGLARSLFRGQVASDYGKELRWKAERWLGGETEGELTRNQILSEPVAAFQNRRPELTDILQEYFVPKREVARFAARAAELVGASACDLLNCTLRNVLPDPDAFLRYAREEVFGFVLLFCIEKSPAADARLGELGRKLTDAALAVGGTYYLPYRLSATPAQLERAYPMARAFFEKKRGYDPSELLSNHFYERYGKLGL